MIKKRDWWIEIGLVWQTIFLVSIIGFGISLLLSIFYSSCSSFTCSSGFFLFHFLTYVFLGFVLGVILQFSNDWFHKGYLEVSSWLKVGVLFLVIHIIFFSLALVGLFELPSLINNFYLLPMFFAQFVLELCVLCDAYAFFGLIWISAFFTFVGSLIGLLTDKTVWFSLKSISFAKKTSKNLSRATFRSESRPRSWVVVLVMFLLVIFIPLLICIFSARLVAFDLDFYHSEFESYNPQVDSAFPIASNLVSYLQNKDVGVDYIDVFNDQEVSHLKDVKLLMHSVLFVFNVCFVLFILLLVSLFFLNKSDFLKNASFCGIFGGALSAVSGFVLFSLAKNWDWFFTKFHSLFFTPGTWSFGADSKLVTLLPQQFWVDAFNKVLSNALISTLVLVFSSFVILFIVKSIDKKFN